MSNDELLLALSEMINEKLEIQLKPIREAIQENNKAIQENKNDLHNFRLYVENEIEPKIQLLAENYVPAAKRYEKAIPEMDEIKKDVDILKKVVAEHSEKLQKISWQSRTIPAVMRHAGALPT